MRRLWSDCVGVQSNLIRRISLMPEELISINGAHDQSHVISLFWKQIYAPIGLSKGSLRS